jgi:hypothetical protein
MHLHFIVSRPLLGLLTKLAIDTTSQSICNVRCRWLQDLGWQSLTLDAEPGRTKSPAHVLRALRGEIYLGKTWYITDVLRGRCEYTWWECVVVLFVERHGYSGGANQVAG